MVDVTAAFTLRTRDTGLSLFRADLATPRSALQEWIDALNHPPRPELTPDDLLEQGFRVVQVPLSAFEEHGFRCGAPDDRGHFEVYAPAACREPAAEFEQYSATFARAARIVLQAYVTRG